MTSVVIDPVKVAEKVLATARGWSQTSVFEIKAMAGFILYEREAEPGDPDPIFETDNEAVLARIDAVRVPELIAEINRTFAALETARFSARESACRDAYKRALKALSDHFSMEIADVQR